MVLPTRLAVVQFDCDIQPDSHHPILATRHRQSRKFPSRRYFKQSCHCSSYHRKHCPHLPGFAHKKDTRPSGTFDLPHGIMGNLYGRQCRCPCDHSDRSRETGSVPVHVLLQLGRRKCCAVNWLRTSRIFRYPGVTSTSISNF